MVHAKHIIPKEITSSQIEQGLVSTLDYQSVVLYIRPKYVHRQAQSHTPRVFLSNKNFTKVSSMSSSSRHCRLQLLRQPRSTTRTRHSGHHDSKMQRSQWQQSHFTATVTKAVVDQHTSIITVPVPQRQRSSR